MSRARGAGSSSAVERFDHYIRTLHPDARLDAAIVSAGQRPSLLEVVEDSSDLE